MAKRLEIDSHVLAYWGFDEANETDPAVDEASYLRHLTVSNAVAVIPARANNGRQFNGSSTYAWPADTTPFRVLGDFTLVVWILLDQVNSSGSFLRCIIECSEAGSSEGENCLYGLYFSSSGEFVYRHDHIAQPVIMKTAPEVIRSGRYYSVALRRANGHVEVYIDNILVPWASVTVDGVPQDVALPVPAPTGGQSTTLYVGKSRKYADAFWQGTLDEMSLHDVARTYNPYLRGTYFRLTLYTLFYRLSVFNNVRSVGSAEMGGGTRWWVYERNQSLYAIRENTLGLFSPEVQLTQIGLQVNGTMGPGGAGSPELIYDKENDVLYVVFLSSGRVYKLTAGVGDAPATQMMPYTADTAGIAKVATQPEMSRPGTGASSLMAETLTFINRTPIKQWASEVGTPGDGAGWLGGVTKSGLTSDLGEWTPAAPPTIWFTTTPEFGLLLENNNAYGVAFFSYIAGVETLLGIVTAHEHRIDESRSVYYMPIPDRVYGMQYYAKSLDRGGEYGVNVSNTIQDLFGLTDSHDLSSLSTLVINRSGQAPELFALGTGSVTPMAEILTYINRTPIKQSAGDYTGTISCGPGPLLTMGCTPSPTAPQRLPVSA